MRIIEKFEEEISLGSGVVIYSRRVGEDSLLAGFGIGGKFWGLKRDFETKYFYYCIDWGFNYAFRIFI